MRIGMILDKGFPPDSRVENEALTLLNQGHDVVLFCWNFGDQPETEIINGIRIHRYKLSQKLFDLLSPLALSVPIYNHVLSHYLKQFLSEYRPDVIHAHDMVALEPVIKASKKSTPIVLDLHENRPEIMKTYTHINSGLGKFLVNTDKWEKKQKEVVSIADKLIVVTEEAKIDILHHQNIDEQNIYVVPNTVSVESFLEYPIDKMIIERYKSSFVVLYLGSTGLRRGTDTAIRSIAILKNKIKNIKLVLVGKSRDDGKLIALARDLNVIENVDFEGWQNVKLFPSYIRASDVCISPLVRNRHHDTTYPNKLFQYMSLAKPVIVSDCTAQRNVVEKEQCGLIHAAGDAEELARQIEKLYNDKELSNKFGEKGKKAIFTQYNWTETAAELVKLYKTLEKGIKNEKIL